MPETETPALIKIEISAKASGDIDNFQAAIDNETLNLALGSSVTVELAAGEYELSARATGREDDTVKIELKAEDEDKAKVKPKSVELEMTAFNADMLLRKLAVSPKE